MTTSPTIREKVLRSSFEGKEVKSKR